MAQILGAFSENLNFNYLHIEVQDIDEKNMTLIWNQNNSETVFWDLHFIKKLLFTIALCHIMVTWRTMASVKSQELYSFLGYR